MDWENINYTQLPFLNMDTVLKDIITHIDVHNADIKV